MAFRSWAKLLGATLGAGALAGVSQLGLAYGLGIVRLSPTLDITQRDEWVAQLAWVAWFTMASAAVGGLVGRRLLPPRSAAGTRIVAAVTAALGAAVLVPLTMQPARTAQVQGVRPAFVICVCAVLSAAVAVVAAYAALSRAAARWNLTTVGVAVWLIAVASAVPSLDPSGPLPAVRLGVFDARFLTGPMPHRSALLTMPALALLCGVVSGWAARRRALSTLSVAVSGLAGPALLTVSYLIAGPGAGTDRYQAMPYWAAMTAAGAGMLGSVLVAMLRRRPSGVEAYASGKPTPYRPPLPRRDARPTSAIAQAGSGAGGSEGAPAGPVGRATVGPAGGIAVGLSGGTPVGPSGTPVGPSGGTAGRAGGFIGRAGFGGRARFGGRAAVGEGAAGGRGVAGGEATGGRGAGAGAGAEPGDGFGAAAGATAPPQPPLPATPKARSKPSLFAGFTKSQRRSAQTEAGPGPGTPPGRSDSPHGALGTPQSSPAPTPGRTGAPQDHRGTAQNRPVQPPSRPAQPGPTQGPPGPAQARSGPAQGPSGAAPNRPQPHPMNAPPVSPQPITSPLSITPAPSGPARNVEHRPDTPATGRDRDFVDWVSGLGRR